MRRKVVRVFNLAAVATLLTVAQVSAAEMNASPDATLQPEIARPFHSGESQTAGIRAERHPFAAGRWLLSGYGSAAVGKTSHQVYAGHVGLGYHFMDHISLNLEGAGYFVDHAHATGGGGLDLLPRWHYLTRDHWSLYLDGGGGFIYTSDTLRDPGTHFNFTVQGGAGATYDVTDRFIAMGGVRWFHISNARIRGQNRNVGFDSPMFYLGLMKPW